MNKRFRWSLINYFLSLLIVIVAATGIFIWWAVGDQLPKVSQLPISADDNATAPPAPDELVVVSYNIGHGQGVKEDATDYRDKETTLSHLDMLADAMTRMNADIFLLQEVDLDSHRTARINQLEYIRARTKHPYYACAPVWVKNYLPYPYWPVKHHLGYMRSANCILSRFPLSNHERIVFDKPVTNPFFYNLGYIDRVIERVDVDVGSHKLALLNVHLEAWKSDTRELQIKLVDEYIRNISLPVIIGGDFNTVPPGTEKTKGFTDDPDIDFAKEKTLTWFYENAQNIIIPKLSAPTESKYERYSYPSNDPDRHIDHIFLFGNMMSFVDFRIVKEASVASDHLPVMARIKIAN